MGKDSSWVEMDHSVVILGWGKDEDTGLPYWILRNSYGPDWGMDGDFLIRRGSNDFGIEVENIAFEPVLCSEESTPDQCIPMRIGTNIDVKLSLVINFIWLCLGIAVVLLFSRADLKRAFLFDQKI